MTTEDDFQAALDAKPEDWQTRLVFADWLQERGDPRADGYRALGVLRLWPKREGEGEGGTWAYQGGVADDYPACHTLPRDWFDADSPGNTYWTQDLDTRRESEDAAARAFAKLPPERRAELLAGER